MSNPTPRLQVVQSETMGKNGRSPFLSSEQRDILSKSGLCANLDENQRLYFFEVCDRTLLDPFTGQIHVEIRESNGEKSMILVTTLQGFRAMAERSGMHDGEEGPEWCDAEGNWTSVWLKDEHPKAARASVFRKDRTRPQTAVVLWDAVAQIMFDKQGNRVVADFWDRMGPHMLGKCALAGAYRGAHSGCSGLYIPEEIAKQIDPNSEEAIEAEMIERARREKEYWDKERVKGNLPIHEIQAIQRAQAEQVAVDAVQVVNAELSTETQTVVQNASQDWWKDFKITRIRLFAGRSVSSLTTGEVKGLRPWIEKIANNWKEPQVDEEIKTHYNALVERTNRDIEAEEAQLERLPDGLDFGEV